MAVNTHTINKRKTRRTAEESRKSRQRITKACVTENTATRRLADRVGDAWDGTAIVLMNALSCKTAPGAGEMAPW